VDRPAEIHPLVAGVCSRLAWYFHCNAWLLRAGFIVLLMVKSFWALAVYGGLALLFRCTDHYRGPVRSAKKDFSLESPQFAARNHRIRALDRRFREWEESERQ
jgi:phage shock protein PspC (stress-responsive transcriptional regulator)